MDDNFIPPKDWVKKLHGADVLVKFNVVHQWFGRASVAGSKKDNYYADVEEIRLLRAARPPPTNVNKRPPTEDYVLLVLISLYEYADNYDIDFT